jgi:hypothetical protein
MVGGSDRPQAVIKEILKGDFEEMPIHRKPQIGRVCVALD